MLIENTIKGIDNEKQWNREGIKRHLVAFGEPLPYQKRWLRFELCIVYRMEFFKALPHVSCGV